MGALFHFVLHHPESVDPELIDSIRHEIDAILGTDALAIVIVLGFLIVALPLGIAVAAIRRARHHARLRQHPDPLAPVDRP